MTYDQRHNINILQPERHWLMPQGIVDFDADVIASNPLVYWNAQELTGSVLGTTYNPAVALGRDIIINGGFDADTDWTKGVGWSIAAGVAHSDGTGGLLSQVTNALEVGKTWRVTYTIKNYSSGSVKAALGSGAAVLTSRNADGTYIEDAIQTNSVQPTTLYFLPTAFIGDVDDVIIEQIGILASSAYPGANVAGNTFADYGGGANWVNLGNEVVRCDGSQVGNSNFSDASVTEVGKTYDVVFTISNYSAGNVHVRLSGSGAAGTSRSANGTYSERITADGTSFLFRADVNFIGNIDLKIVSVTEPNPLNGDDTGTALGTATGTNLGVARTGDGTTSYIKFYSAELNSMLSWLIGSFIFYGQSNTWAAGVDYFFNMSIDANNGISCYRTGTDIVVDYQVGGVSTSVTIPSLSPAGWFQIAFTWEYPGNLIVYYQGVQSGTPQAIAAPVVGNLDENLVVWMSLNDTPSNVLDGSITQLQPLYDRVLPVSEISAQKQGAGI